MTRCDKGTLGWKRVLQARARSLVGMCALACLWGCGVHSFRSDFVGYNKAYAAMLNEQMLLNLARLENGHPPYFMMPGAIDAKYNFGQEASGTFTRNSTDATSDSATSQVQGGVLGLASQVVGATTNVVSGTVGGLKVSRGESPNFKIIPLNDAEIARQVISPIPNDVFYALYQQGYPIDLLLRVMVERIEIVEGGRKEELVNSATRSSAQSYIRFLNTCAVLREMQRSGSLDFTVGEHFRALTDYQSGDAPVRRKSAPRAANPDPGDDPDLLPPIEEMEFLEEMAESAARQPTPLEIMEARKQGYDYHEVGGRWKFGVWSKNPTFSILPRSRISTAELGRRPALQGVDALRIQRTLDTLRTGIDVKTGDQKSSITATRLVLRSYSRVLDAAATEQKTFDAFLAAHGSQIAPSQHQPIVRTRWDASAQVERPLVSLQYHQKRYAITDLKGSSQTRDAFRLLVGLSTQVSADITKFQNQYLEIR